MNRADDLFLRLEAEGVDVLDQFISDRKAEELFLDFKASANDGKRYKLHSDDRKNLSKALSGFANSEGGVVIWGVDARKLPDGADVAQGKKPIENPERFVSWLEQAISGCTVPPCPGVRNIVVGDGFAATLVPKSDLAPHRSVTLNNYYIRAGSSFSPVTHDVLAGLFGRRPQAKVVHQFFVNPVTLGFDNRPGVTFKISLNVTGRAIARDLYLVLEIIDPGSPSNIKLSQEAEEQFTYYQLLKVHTSAVSHPSFRLPPGGRVVPISINLELFPPFSRGLKISGVCGCEGSVPQRFDADLTTRDLKELYENLLECPSDDRSDVFMQRVFGDPLES